MKIQLETANSHLNVFRTYGPGQITVNETIYRASLIVTPNRIIDDWPPQTFVELKADHFETIMACNPELVILGTGRRLQFPHAAVTRLLVEAHVGLEVMDTGAACRTYNVLTSEGRRVVAALLMIEEQEDK
ncbi:MAG: Mth938-like domain-containing protein [Acidiferrobacterales bacterium]